MAVKESSTGWYRWKYAYDKTDKWEYIDMDRVYAIAEEYFDQLARDREMNITWEPVEDVPYYILDAGIQSIENEIHFLGKRFDAYSHMIRKKANLFDFGIDKIDAAPMQPAWLRVVWKDGRTSYMHLRNPDAWEVSPFWYRSKEAE